MSLFLVKMSGATPGVLNFNYKQFVGKHVPNISLPKVPTFEEAGLDEDMLELTPLSRSVRSHILKSLILKAKVLQEIIPHTLLEIKCVKV